MYNIRESLSLHSYQAIFFDRDGTLSRNSVQKATERDRAIGKIIGREDFCLTSEMYMDIFWRVMQQPGIKPVNTLVREDAFWRRWYQLILEDYEIEQDAKVFASELYERFCFYEMMEPFPETIRVLEVLKAQGFHLGVISDTFPSLEESLKAMGIAGYFESFTASSIVGVGKPHPKIFQVATQSLDVNPQRSIFVDDCKEEANGAREQGFTAFHLDRDYIQPSLRTWTIGSLEHLLEFLGITQVTS
jgi:putative hydrolase of the HAD superfamily